MPHSTKSRKLFTLTVQYNYSFFYLSKKFNKLFKFHENKNNITDKTSFLDKSNLECKSCLKGRFPGFRKPMYLQPLFKSNKRGKKIICRSFPDRDAEFKSYGFEKQENSLLNAQEEIPGDKINLSNVNANTLQNTPGIYAIRCKINRKYLVGESENIKHRILTKLTQLLQKQRTNLEFVQDLQKYGLQNFDLVLFKTGAEYDNFIYRRFIEYRLQSELSSKQRCYNKGIAEHLHEPAKGFYPHKPGIYCIRCKVNNACYFGETEQRNGLAGRISRHKSNLRSFKESNIILQIDWYRYGEEAFDFMVLDYGSKWLDLQTRLIEEDRLIKNHEENGGIVYNKFSLTNPRKGPFLLDLSLQSDYKAMKKLRKELINHPRPRVTNKFQKAVVAENNIYLTISEAARCLSVHRTNIVGKLKSGTYTYASEEQIRLEKLRRENSKDPKNISGVKVALKKRSPGKSKPVSIEGIVYDSIADAAKARKVSSTAIRKSLNRGRKGFYWVDSNSEKTENQ